MMWFHQWRYKRDPDGHIRTRCAQCNAEYSQDSKTACDLPL